jgi:hypothetical protein
LVDLVDATELVHGLSSVVLNTADESIRMKAVYLILEVLKKKSLSVTQQVEDTLLGSLLGITSLPNSHTLVNNVLGKLNLGNAKKIEDETGQKYSWLFVNSIVDGVTAHARANPSVVARILKGLDSKTKSMRVFSGLVLMKMMHDQLLSVHQYKTVVKFVKEYVSTNDIELDHVDVKKHHSHPPIVFGSWYVNSEFEKLEMTGVMLLLLSVIDHYKPAEKNYYISTDQVLYNEIIEVILYTGRAKDVLKRFLEKQIGERVLEFGFGGLESSVVVLSTTLGIACKYIQANAKSTNPKDLQVVLAPLLVCLTHAEKSVRAIAVGVLAALKNSLEAYAKINGKVSKSSIYGYGTFFGSKSKEMEFLGSKTSVEFVDAVLERGHDIIADADHLKLNFKLVLKKLNQKY